MPSRGEALNALLALNAKPKTHVDQTEVSRPSTSAGVASRQSGITMSVRERMSLAEHAPAAETKAETWDEQVARRRREVLAEAERRREARERERELAEKRRLKAENDAKYLKELAERNQRVAEQNFLTNEIRDIFRSMDAFDIVAEVVPLVRSWKTERFAPSYLTAIEEVRARQQAP